MPRCALGAPSNDKNREALGRSRGGLTSKIHLLAEMQCRPLARITSAGQRHDSLAFLPLMGQLAIARCGGAGRPRTSPGRVLGDKAGVIGCRRLLTSAQRGDLGRVLALIGLNHRGPLILHHGCGAGADEVAHRIVRKLGGWRIHGHPSRDATDGSTGRAKCDFVHESKPRAERNADIVNASRILVVIPPYPEADPRSSQSEIWMAIRMARAVGREIMYVPRPRRRQEPGSRKATQKQGSVIAHGVKDVTWAARQGRIDRKAGTDCRKYKRFIGTYNLSESGLTLQMWTAYKQATQQTPVPANAPHTCRRCRKPVPNSRERWGWLCENCESPPDASDLPTTEATAAGTVIPYTPSSPACRAWANGDDMLTRTGQVAEPDLHTH